jgi:phosphate-selective porin OprO/OprP
MFLGGELAFVGRKSRFAASSVVAIAVGLAMSGAAVLPAHAADDQQLQLLSDQIRQLQAQIDALKKDQAKAAAAAQAQAAPIGSNKPALGYQTGSHQFGWASADGQDSIELTGRLHFDVGDYLRYGHSAALTNPRSVESGWDARRARIGVTGKFAGDFNYTLIADFGGSDDGTNPYASGFASSEIENAYITYNGFNKVANPVPLAFDVGYIDAPFTLDEATSSNDIMFLERSSSQVVATAFGAGDNRSAIGARSYKTNYWAGFYVTGPTSGSPHNNPSSAQGATSATESTVPNGEPLAVLGRATYNPYSDDVSSVHVGVNTAYVIQPGATVTTVTGGGVPTAAAHSFTLSDRPELRIDPTAFLSTGAINYVNDAYVLGAEAAGAWEHFFAQGEYYHYVIDRYATAAQQTPTLNFDGGYGEISYSFGGKRNYNPSTGAYTGVIPDAPLSLKEGGGWGAVELAARVSVVNLNDHTVPGLSLTNSGGVEGGDQTVYTFGVNYYASTNVRIMLDYIHATINKSTFATGAVTPTNAHIDALAARFQVAF